MTYTFIDYEKDNSRREGEKKGKLSAFYELVKDGIITLKQAADKMNMTIPQFELAIKDLTTE